MKINKDRNINMNNNKNNNSNISANSNNTHKKFTKQQLQDKCK